MGIERTFLNEQEQREVAQEIIQKCLAYLESLDIVIKEPIDYTVLQGSIVDTLIDYKLVPNYKEEK